VPKTENKTAKSFNVLQYISLSLKVIWVIVWT